MEILKILLGLVIFGGILYAFSHAAVFAGIVLIALVGYVPAIVGVVSGGFMWHAGHDNLGALTGIIGIVSNFFWFAWWEKKISGGAIGYSYDPMEDKKKHYDKDGNVIGYEDKD